ncbi:NAD(P)-binding protein [Alternaria alternata]|nr:NAD(P)-binding protein [Alternaria alternata]
MSSNMRVAIAGSCTDTHQHQTSLIASGYNCQAVDYNNPASLQHALMGVDTVISTVMGNPQLRLIEAAVQCRVRRFAPAEFEGQPGLRGQNALLDRGRNSALALLHHYRSHMQYTVFVCGILYERFSVNGMISHRLGVNSGYGNEGEFIADPRQMTSMAPIYDAANNLSSICLTSAYDVAQFVVRALDMPTWPSEMSMCGERMTVHALVETIRACRSKYSPSLPEETVC